MWIEQKINITEKALHNSVDIDNAIKDLKKIYKGTQKKNAIIGMGLTIIIPFLIQLSLAIFMTIQLSKSLKKNSKLTSHVKSFLKDGNDWQVYIMEDKIPNAFVVMGKSIFITSGLQKILSEREIMAVMLHEISHLKNNDSFKRIVSKSVLGSIVLASLSFVIGLPAMFLTILLYYLFANELSTIIINRTLGRHHETQADNFAVKHGYANELASALKKLEKVFKRLEAKFECDRFCQLLKKINESLGEHPPLKKRTENILKKKEIWVTAMKGSFVNIRKMLFKNFGVEKPV